jgi:hypothetical protein
MILRGITERGAVREQRAAVERGVADATAEAADAAEAAVRAKVCQPGRVKTPVKRNVATVDVCPFCGSGSSDLVLYNGWKTCLVCNEDWRP